MCMSIVCLSFCCRSLGQHLIIDVDTVMICRGACVYVGGCLGVSPNPRWRAFTVANIYPFCISRVHIPSRCSFFSANKNALYIITVERMTYERQIWWNCFPHKMLHDEMSAYVEGQRSVVTMSICLSDLRLYLGMYVTKSSFFGTCCLQISQ